MKLADKSEWKTAPDLDAFGEAIKAAIEKEVPATFVSVSQPIEDRVNQLLSGSRDVVVKVFGSDLVVSKSVADRIGQVLAKVQGTGDLRVQRVLGLPLLNVKADRKRLARYGIPATEVLDMVEASRVGRTVGKIFEDRADSIWFCCFLLRSSIQNRLGSCWWERTPDSLFHWPRSQRWKKVKDQR